MGNRFILSIDEATYQSLKSKRELKESPQIKGFYKLKENDQLIVYLKDEERVVAEYEIKEINVTDSYISIVTEPVYNAPKSNGVKTDDILYLQLTTFSSNTHWKYELNKPITKINDEDYQILTEKLIHG